VVEDLEDPHGIVLYHRRAQDLEGAKALALAKAQALHEALSLEE